MRSLIDICDFSTEELYDLMACATDIIDNPDKYRDSLKGKILATLFFEPSTRTRLSFESAMLGLGGSVLGFSGAGNSSAAKGETMADTAQVVSHYADIIATRHPLEGAPLVASENASIPVINAGDGGHCHPTQTLADILTIYREIGRLDHLRVGFCGDLKYGRTVHSLISALSRYEGNEIVLISPDELKLPCYIKQDVIEANGMKCTEVREMDEVMPALDVLYMTRVQGERFSSYDEYLRLRDVYTLTTDKMNLAKEDMIVLHPLPRVNEIAVEVDSDPRAAYFRQAMNGKFMRMALILKLIKDSEDKTKVSRVRGEGIVHDIPCQNPRCITVNERGLRPSARINLDGIHRCVYCDSIVKK